MRKGGDVDGGVVGGGSYQLYKQGTIPASQLGIFLNILGRLQNSGFVKERKLNRCLMNF